MRNHQKSVARWLALVVVLAGVGLWCCGLVYAEEGTKVGAKEKARRVTVGAYNVEWLLDVFDDPYTNDQKRPPKPREEMEKIARAIKALDPDVMTLAEVENEGVLKAFVAELLGSRGYRYVAVDATNSDYGQHLGVISKLPIVSMTSYRFTGLDVKDRRGRVRKFARDLWELRIRVTPERDLYLFAVHLKSKLDSVGDEESEKWRVAEVEAIRKIVEAGAMKADAGAWVLVQGDFNDTPGSEAIRKMLEKAEGGGRALVDLHAGLPARERVTYRERPYHDDGPIDFMFASKALADRVVAESVKVLSDPELVGGSDHSPIAASFEVGE